MALRADDVPLPPDLVFDNDPVPPGDLDATVDALLSRSALTQKPVDEELAAELLLREGTDAERFVPSLLLPVSARRFRVEDDRAAEWAMRHQADALAVVAEIDRQADDYVARIREWQARTTSAPKAKAAVMAAFGLDYLRRQREAGRPTVNLPSGVLRSRKVPAKPHVQDSPTSAAWVRETLPPEDAELVIKTEVRVSELAKHVTLVEMTVGAWYHVTLSCGHEVEGEAVGLTAKLVREVIAVPGSTWWTCDECSESSKVVTVDANDVLAWRAIDANGEIVPGVTVEAPKVSYKAVPA